MVNAGEVRYLWDRGMIQNRLCGCGRPFADCTRWQAVLSDAFGARADLDASRAAAEQASQTRVRHIPRLLASARRPTALPPPAAHGVRLTRLYASLAAISGASVIVDSSKLPSYGYLLERVPGIDLRVLHLVRDPRAAAFSWLRKKEQPDRGTPGIMAPQGVVRSSLLWTLWNATTELLWRRARNRYLRLRYEDLVADPSAGLERVLAFVGLEGSVLPMIDGHTARLEATHSVAGNPNRLVHGQVAIRNDDEWERFMPMGHRGLVTVLTAPLLGRYGYRVVARRSSSADRDGHRR